MKLSKKIMLLTSCALAIFALAAWDQPKAIQGKAGKFHCAEI
jgi:hypothetical protein